MTADTTADTTITRQPFRHDAPGGGEPWAQYLRLVYAEGLPRDAEALGAVSLVYPAPHASIVIGRAPGSVPGELALALSWDGSASRRHCRVTRLDEDRVRVEDLGSRNGTFVDGHPVGGSVEATVGQVIRVGGSLLVVARGQLLRRRKLASQQPPPDWLRLWSASTVALWDRLATLAGSDVGVLLFGEMGSGKTRLARALHEASPRRSGPFLSYNCGAIPHHLEEATLFGVVGGFIPGVKARSGWLTMARSGTLFLDELAEMPPLAQAKLLDAFDTNEPSYVPVGSTRRERTDCRLVSATNRDVFALAAQGLIRQDLLSRLVTGHVTVPPLRERREEIVDLGGRLLDAAGASPGPLLPRVEQAEALVIAAWTENVRGLETLMQRVALGERLAPEDIATHANRGLDAAPPGPAPTDAPGPIPETSKGPPPAPTGLTGDRPWPPPLRDLLVALAGNEWSVSQTADALGKRRETVSRLIRTTFGRGGRSVAQQVYRIWQTSGRLPSPEQAERLHQIYYELPDTPDVLATRAAWAERGEVA